MKNISTYITEKLKITSSLPKYLYVAEDREDLINIVNELLVKRGKDADFNDIDVSNIDNFTAIFSIVFSIEISTPPSEALMRIQHIDVSEWNMHNAIHTYKMFYGCRGFDCDLSNWDVSNLRDAGRMFSYCTRFCSDLSTWNTHNLEYTQFMFYECTKFNSDLSRWDTHKLKLANRMFAGCQHFSYDLSDWNIPVLQETTNMFYGCDTLKDNDKLPSWYK